MNSCKDDINYIIRMLVSKVLNLKIHITKKRNIKARTRRQIDIQYDYEDIKEEKYEKCNIY